MSHIRKKIAASSFGSKNATAARRTVSSARARSVAARASQIRNARSKSGGKR
jgi:hypothetical protein